MTRQVFRMAQWADVLGPLYSCTSPGNSIHIIDHNHPTGWSTLPTPDCYMRRDFYCGTDNVRKFLKWWPCEVLQAFIALEAKGMRVAGAYVADVPSEHLPYTDAHQVVYKAGEVEHRRLTVSKFCIEFLPESEAQWLLVHSEIGVIWC